MVQRSDKEQWLIREWRSFERHFSLSFIHYVLMEGFFCFGNFILTVLLKTIYNFICYVPIPHLLSKIDIAILISQLFSALIISGEAAIGCANGCGG